MLSPMTTRTMTATTLAALALLLAGCSANGHSEGHAASSPTKSSSTSTSSAASSSASATAGPTSSASPSAQPSGPLANDTPHVEPFTLNDTVTFTSSTGATGTITFNQAAPADVAQGLQWAGKPAGVWAVAHLDNRNGTQAVNFSDVAPLLLDEAGTRYPMQAASDVAANLYGDASSDDPHQNDYYDIYDRYSKAQGQVVPGEVRDIHLYSDVPLPEKLARGTVSIDADPDPLMIQK